MSDVSKININISNKDLSKYMTKNADVNKDGKVDIIDVTNLQGQVNNDNHIKIGIGNSGNSVDFGKAIFNTNDITGDGKVDQQDVQAIQNYITGDLSKLSNSLDIYKKQEIYDTTYKKIYSDDLSEQEKYLEKIKATINLMENTRNGKDEEEPGWHFGGDALKQRQPGIHFTKEEQKEIEKKYGSLENLKSIYEEQIASIKEVIKQIDKDLSLIPYQKIQDSAEYKNSNISETSKINYNLLNEEYGEKHATTDTYTMAQESKARQEKLIQIFGSLNNAKEAYDKIKYLTDSERDMYFYVISTKGIDAANEYLNIFDKDLKCRQALSEALEFYNTLLEKGEKLSDEEVKKLLYENIGEEETDKIVKQAETNGLTVFRCFWQGLKDGNVNFFEGLGHIFDNETEQAVSDYKKEFIAQLLSSGGYTDEFGNQLSGSDMLSGSYNFGTSTGNMMPVILASTLASLIATPAGGEAVFAGMTASELAGKIAGSALIGLSSFGNSKHEALCNGYSLQQAIISGALNGLSDAGFETLLGSIPGIGTESKSWIMSVLKEGTQEYLQTYVSAGIESVVLGKEIKLDELDAEAQQSFLMGAMMGGMFNTGKLLKNVKVSINGINHKLTPSQIADYIKNGTTVDSSGASREITIDEYLKTRKKVSSEGYNLNDFKYKDTTISNSAINYIKSNIRKYKYTNTNSVAGLNAKIQQNGLYHFTSSADAVLNSGYVKASGMVSSYGNKKSFFFNGIPNVGEYVSNLDSLPLKAEAVKINPNTELLNSSKLKIRNFDDGAISYDGNLDIKNVDASKEYFCLVKDGDELVYKPVTKEEYDNYQNTAEGQAIQNFVSDKKNVEAIKNDYYARLSSKVNAVNWDKIIPTANKQYNSGKVLTINIDSIEQIPDDAFNKIANANFKVGNNVVDLKQAYVMKNLNLSFDDVSNIQQNPISYYKKYTKELNKIGYDFDDFVNSLKINVNRFGVQDALNAAVKYNDKNIFLITKCNELLSQKMISEGLYRNLVLKPSLDIDSTLIQESIKKFLTENEQKVLNTIKNSGIMNLTDQERNALYQYQKAGGMEIINYNRGDMTTPLSVIEQKMNEFQLNNGTNILRDLNTSKTIVEEIDSALSKNLNNDTITAVRYCNGVGQDVDFSGIFDGTRAPESLIGESFNDSANTSYTILHDKYTNYSGINPKTNDYRNRIKIEAVISPNTGAFIESVGGLQRYSVMEFLSVRNTNSKIIDSYFDTTGRLVLKVLVEKN